MSQVAAHISQRLFGFSATGLWLAVMAILCTLLALGGAHHGCGPMDPVQRPGVRRGRDRCRVLSPDPTAWVAPARGLTFWLPSSLFGHCAGRQGTAFPCWSAGS
jgi:hypothetical protein